MTIPNFKKCMLATSLLATFGMMQPAVAKTTNVAPPNVIVIVADDLGHADAGFYGDGWNSADTISNQTMANVTKIAKSGAVFNHGYVTAPVCGPSRAGMLTGRYQQRFGFYSNPSPDDVEDTAQETQLLDKSVEPGVPVEEQKMGHYFQQAGYTTAFIGKDHDGEAYKFWPHNRGFDYFFGFNNGAAAYSIGDRNKENAFTTPHSTMWETFPESYEFAVPMSDAEARQIVEDHNKLLHSLGDGLTENQRVKAFHAEKTQQAKDANTTYDPEVYKEKYYSALEKVVGLHIAPDFLLNDEDEHGEPVQNKDGYLTNKFGERAVNYIDQHAGGSEPFMLYLAFNAVHTPLSALDNDIDAINSATEFVEDKENGDLARKTALAMAKSLDENVGLIRKKLQEKRILQNTMIVFIADNGGKPKSNYSSNLPLDGHKGELHEGGIRVPFMISWPSVIKRQLVVDEPVISLDILPTALNATNMPDSELAEIEEKLDGINLLPRLIKPEKSSVETVSQFNKRYLYWDRVNKAAISDGQFKLLKIRKKQFYLFRMRDCDAGDETCNYTDPANYREFVEEEKTLDDGTTKKYNNYDQWNLYNKDGYKAKADELEAALADFQCNNLVPKWGVSPPDATIYGNEITDCKGNPRTSN